MRSDTAFGEEVVSGALRKGADRAEVFMRSSRGFSVEVKNQEVDSLKSSLSFGYSLRLIKGGRLGFSYATNTDDKDNVISRAIEASAHADRDPYLDLPAPAEAAPVEIFDETIQEMREEDAIAKVMLLERSVYEADRRIKKIRKASGSFTVSATAILNSKSIRADIRSTSCSAQVTAIAEEDGESRMGWDFNSSRFLGDVSFEEIGRIAAIRAARLLGSKKIEGRKADVILDNAVTVDFIGIFASSLSSEAVQKGKSLLAGRIGKKVISDKINMIDSGILRGRLGSSPVDGEGVPTKEKIAISEGVLLTYLYNTYTAAKDRTASTGNAVRGGFSSLPGVGVTNLFIEAASKKDVFSIDEIFRNTESGFYVVDVMGMHTANPITGEFSVGVSGIWIEKGEMAYPVKEAAISGNILDFFGKIQAIGDDLRFYGNIGGPSLLISDVDISA
jgi:PmbA protein